MIPMHAGAAKFNHFATKRLVRRESEFLFAIVAEVRCRELSCLEAIGSDDLAGFLVLDQQMVAARIVSVFVAFDGVRGGEPFPKLKIENGKAQALRRVQVFGGRGEAEVEAWTRTSAGG